MSKESKMMVSGAEANFLQAMLKSAEKKFSDPAPNIAEENPEEIEKVTKELQAKWVRKQR